MTGGGIIERAFAAHVMRDRREMRDRHEVPRPLNTDPPGLFDSEGTSRMTTESQMREAAGRAFVTAFLLSGDAERAEAIVLKSIGSMNRGEASSDELIRDAVYAAVEPEEVPVRFPKKRKPAFSMLPFELQGVLDLPHYPRQCFVLRVLVGLPREVCAKLLSSKVLQIDEGARAAMLQLPATGTRILASHT